MAGAAVAPQRAAKGVDPLDPYGRGRRKRPGAPPLSDAELDALSPRTPAAGPTQAPKVRNAAPYIPPARSGLGATPPPTQSGNSAGVDVLAQQQQDKEDGDLDYLAQMQKDQAAERKAREAELERERVRTMQGQAAANGLGGLGLSGASSALLNDTQASLEQARTLALADLDRQQRDEQWSAIQRQAALDDLEEAEGRDINGDGLIAGGSAAKAKQLEQKRGEIDAYRAARGERAQKDEVRGSSKALRDTINTIAEGLGFDGDMAEVVKKGKVPAGAIPISAQAGWRIWLVDGHLVFEETT